MARCGRGLATFGVDRRGGAHMRSSSILIGSWTTFVLSIVLALYGVMASVGAFYHPNAPTSPYTEYLTLVALVAIPVTLILAVRHSIVFRKRTAKRLVMELGVFGGFVTVAALASLLLVEPVPEFFLQHAGSDPYRVPSKFTSVRNIGPGENAGVRLDYCAGDLSGLYESRQGSCQSATLGLSKRDITDSFGARYFLKQEAIPHEGDRILAVDAIRLTRHPADGWTGFSTEGSETKPSPYDRHMMLDANGRLIRFVQCYRGSDKCRVFARTALGRLSYEFFGGPRFQPDAWQAVETDLVNLLLRFRVDAPS